GQGHNQGDALAVPDQWRRDLRVVSEVARGLLGNRWGLRVADDGRDLQRPSSEHRSSDVGARIEWNRKALRQFLEARLAFESRDLDHASRSRPTKAKLEPNRRSRLPTIASTPGWVSVVEPLIEDRISPVAVCRSSASLVSSNSRTFSIAITAWSAKVSASSICFSVNGCTSARRTARE